MIYLADLFGDDAGAVADLKAADGAGQMCDTSSMKPKNIGMFLLAIYLILIGVIGVAGISLGQLSILVPLLAIAAGVFLLLGK